MRIGLALLLLLTLAACGEPESGACIQARCDAADARYLANIAAKVSGADFDAANRDVNAANDRFIQCWIDNPSYQPPSHLSDELRWRKSLTEAGYLRTP